METVLRGYPRFAVSNFSIAFSMSLTILVDLSTVSTLTILVSRRIAVMKTRHDW